MSLAITEHFSSSRHALGPSVNYHVLVLELWLFVHCFRVRSQGGANKCISEGSYVHLHAKKQNSKLLASNLQI